MRTNLPHKLLLFISLVLLTPIFVYSQCATTAPVGVNLITNGDFEQGDVSFTTQYTDHFKSTNGGCVKGSDCNPPDPTKNCGCFRNWSMPNEYMVGSDITLFHFDFKNTVGKGKFMMIDGSCSAGMDVWSKTVNVQPNTNYFFSASIATLGSGTTVNTGQAAKLVFKVGSTTIGSLDATTTVGQWTPYTQTWFSGATSGLVTITIDAPSTPITDCNTGNDFAIDDISFVGGCQFATASTPVPDLGADQIICGKPSITLDPGVPSAGITYLWSTGATTSTLNVTTPGTYSVCISKAGACTRSDVVVITESMGVDIKDASLCNPASATLATGLTNLSYFNSIKWYKNNVEITAEAGKGSITVNEAATYKVVVDGPGGCDANDQAVVTTTSTTTPVNATFCPPPKGNGKAILSVNGTGTYEWYATATGGAALGAGSSFTTPALASGGGPYTYYAQDNTVFPYTIGPAAAPCAGTTEGVERNAVKIVAYENFTIDVLKVMQDNYGGTGTDTYTADLYSDNNGNPGTILKSSAPTSFPKTTTPPNLISVPVNLALTGSAAGTTYWIKFKNGPAIRSMNCAGSFPYKDSGGGTVAQITGTQHDNGNSTNAPSFFGWSISKTSSCGRTPVIATEFCPPCTPPTFTTQPTLTPICFGANATITAAASSTETGTVTYQWEVSNDGGTTFSNVTNGGIYSGATTASLTLTKPPVSPVTSLKYRVTATLNCSTISNVVTLTVKPIPDVTGTGAAICSGKATNIPLTSAVAGTTFAWTITQTGVTGATATNGATIAQTLTNSGTTPGTVVYHVTPTAASCPGTTVDITETVNPIPVVTGNDTTICSGNPTKINLKSTVSGSTFGYLPTGASVTGHAIGTLNPIAQTLTNTGAASATVTYTVAATANSCVSNPLNIVVTVNPIPTAVATDQTICNGATSNVAITSPVTGTTFSWTAVAATGVTGSAGGSTATIAQTLNNANAVNSIVTYSITPTAALCAGPKKDVVVTVNPPLTAGTIGTSDTICTGSSPTALSELTAAKGGTGTYTYQWESSLDNLTYLPVNPSPNATYDPGALTATTYYRRKVTSGACGTVSTPAVKITVDALTTEGAIAADQTVCFNEVPKLFTSTTNAGAGAGVGTYAYMWESSPDKVVWTGIPTATAATFQATGATADIYYRRSVVSGTCPKVYTLPVKLTLTNLTPGSIKASQTICYNTVPAGLAEVTSPGGVNPPFTFTWQNSSDNTNWSDIASTDNKDYAPAALSATTYYRRQVSSVSCGKLATTSVTITVNPELLPGTITADQQICYNTTPAALKEGTAPTGGSGGYTYQWQSSTDNATWNDIVGATLTGYSPGALTVTTYYRRKITSGTCGTVITPSVKITVNPDLTAGTISTVPDVCYNETPKPFTNLTLPTGGTGTYTYEWQSSTDNINFVPVIPAGTLEDYQSGPLTQTTYFRRQVMSGTCGPLYTASSAIVINVTPGVIEKDQTICYNSVPAELTEKTAPTGVAGVLQYQWQISLDNLTFANIPLANAKTYTPGSLTNTVYIRRNLLNVCNGKTLSTTSVKITVYPDLTAGAAGTAQTICSGDKPALLTELAAATGGTGSYTYQWQASTDNASWADEAVAANSTYQPGALTANTWYRRGVTSGSCGTLYSPSFLVTVNPNKPVSVTISDPGAICAGENVSISATPVNGGVTPVYEWYLNGSLVAGVTGDKLSSTTLKDQDEIYAKLISSETCKTGSPATSNTVKMVVSAFVNPKVDINGVTDICSGTAVTFNLAGITGGGNAPKYQWRYNGLSLPGETKDFLTLSGLNDKDSVSLEMISNSACATKPNAISNVLVMTVHPNLTPIVTITVDKNPICAGEKVIFNVALPVTNGGINPSYQWQMDGANLPGQTGTSYTSTTLVNGNVLRVIMKSDERCLTKPTDTSNAITMVVNPILAVSVTTTDPGPLCEGAVANFTATGTNEGTTPMYEWFIGTTSTGVTGVTYSSTTLSNLNEVSVHLTSSEKCQNGPASAKVIMDITPKNAPSVTISAAPAICQGDNATFTAAPLNAGAAGTLQWYLNNVLLLGEINTTYSSSSFATGDIVKVEITSSKKCNTGPVMSLPETLNVNTPIPVDVTITDPGALCEGKNAAFAIATSMNGGTPTYKWKVNGVVVGTSSTYSSTGLQNNDEVKLVMTTSLTCVTNKADSSIVIAQINPIPSALVTVSPDRICDGETATASTTVVPGATYKWTFGSAVVGTDSAYVADKAGIYSVDVTLNGCINSATGSLMVDSKIIVDAGEGTTICKGTPALLSGSANGPAVFLWSNGATDPVITVTPDTSTLYTLKGINGKCESEDTVRIKIKDQIVPTLFIPSTFSPNDDESNDIFKVYGEGIVDLEASVFNRWGEIVYEWQGKEGGWDGAMEKGGAAAINAVYVYSVKVKNECQLIFNKAVSGTVTVIK